MTDIGLRILLQAQDQASRVISGVGNQILKAAGDFKPLLVASGLVGAGILAVGALSTHMAADFQQAMLSNVAHAGLMKNQVNAVSDAILQMAPIVGRSPIELADAMYPILSAFSGITNQGAKAAISLDTLRMSFETVAGTTVDGTSVARAAVGTFNALGLATNNVSTNTKRMTDLFDVMDKTVQLGNMTWDQYKNVISKLAISIQGTGIKFNEASAALATMTNEGFTAQKAQTYLSNTFNTLAIKTNALAAHAKKLGIEFNQSKYGPMSLADKIKYLNDITDGNKQKLLALMGNNATALKTFNALSVGVDAYKSNLNALNHAHGALKSSFDTAASGLNFAWSRVIAFVSVLLIKLGTQLLPILTRLVNAVIPVATWLINMATAISKNQMAVDMIKAVLLALAGVILGVLIHALVAWAAAMIPVVIEWLAMAAPILLIGLVAAAVIFGVMQLIRHWAAVITWLRGLWDVVSKAMGAAFSWLGARAHDVISAIGNLFDWIGTRVHIFFVAWQIMGEIAGAQFARFGGVVQSIISAIGNAFSGLGSLVSGVWSGIVGAVRSAINFIIGLINGFIGGIDSIGIDIGPVHIHPNIPKIPMLATGGYVESTGLALIHRGERVLPARVSSFGSSSGTNNGGTTLIININAPITSREYARALGQVVLDELSRQQRQSGQLITWTSGGRA